MKVLVGLVLQKYVSESPSGASPTEIGVVTLYDGTFLHTLYVYLLHKTWTVQTVFLKLIS